MSAPRALSLVLRVGTHADTLLRCTIMYVQELSHINSWLHHRLHGHRAAKFGLVAIAAIMVGHLTEHFHQEQGQDADQAKFKKLEDRILVLEETLRENEMQKAKPSNA